MKEMVENSRVSKIIWGNCEEREEQRGEFGTVGNTEQHGQTGRAPGHGCQACQELGWALNSVSCLSVFQSDKARSIHWIWQSGCHG